MHIFISNMCRCLRCVSRCSKLSVSLLTHPDQRHVQMCLHVHGHTKFPDLTLISMLIRYTAFACNVEQYALLSTVVCENQ